jgi:hypothetical protein
VPRRRLGPQVTFLGLHMAQGSPVADDQPLLAGVEIWDQIDGGQEWTTAKRVLITIPVLLFMLTCEFTDYDHRYLIINLLVLIFLELAPKLPFLRSLYGSRPKTAA